SEFRPPIGQPDDDDSLVLKPDGPSTDLLPALRCWSGEPISYAWTRAAYVQCHNVGQARIRSSRSKRPDMGSLDETKLSSDYQPSLLQVLQRVSLVNRLCAPSGIRDQFSAAEPIHYSDERWKNTRSVGLQRYIESEPLLYDNEWNHHNSTDHRDSYGLLDSEDSASLC